MVYKLPTTEITEKVVFSYEMKRINFYITITLRRYLIVVDNCWCCGSQSSILHAFVLFNDPTSRYDLRLRAIDKRHLFCHPVYSVIL